MCLTIMLLVAIVAALIGYRLYAGCRHDVISQDEHSNFSCEECGAPFEQWHCLLPAGASRTSRKIYGYFGIRIGHRLHLGPTE